MGRGEVFARSKYDATISGEWESRYSWFDSKVPSSTESRDENAEMTMAMIKRLLSVCETDATKQKACPTKNATSLLRVSWNNERLNSCRRQFFVGIRLGHNRRGVGMYSNAVRSQAENGAERRARPLGMEFRRLTLSGVSRDKDMQVTTIGMSCQ